MTRMQRWLAGVAAVVVAGTPAYFIVGAIATSRVDDDLAGVTSARVDKPFAIARTMETILAREIERHSWRPDNPWFYPTALTDDPKNFQLGVLHGLRRSLMEYANRTVRQRANAALDPDLQAALSQLQYPPGVWIFDLSQGFASTESQYRAALAALRAFDKKALAGGEYAELRADQLLRFVDAINVDLTAHVLSLQDYAARKSSLFDSRSDDLFYQTKGAAFVYAALAKAVPHDFAPVFASKRLDDLWRQLNENLDRLATLKPLAVITGKDDGLLLPNHLIVQGFYASRCAHILTQIEDILRT